jgi:hypothetical protein
MSSIPSSATVSRDRSWYITGRWQEYEGEARANLLRVIGIGAFYAIELINYHGLNIGFLELSRQADITLDFHRGVTALAVAWTMLGLAIHLCLSRQIFPAALKYVSTGIDLVLLSTILMLADGPRSPLVVGYFLVIALSGLRFNLPLVRTATVGAMLGYLAVCGYAVSHPERALRVPRYHQLMMLVALGLAGIVLGQIIRRVRGLADDYVKRMSGTSSTGS